MRLKRLHKRPIDAPVGARHGFGTCPFDGRNRWHNDALFLQDFQRLPREHYPLVGLHGKVSKAVHQRAKIPTSKCGQPQISAQFLKMVTLRLVVDAMLRPGGGVAFYLAGDPLNYRVRYRHVAGQRIAWIAQQVLLDGEADPVGVAAALSDEG